MYFYRFHQNNSGGGFDHDPVRGIGYEVVIEAESATKANEKAEEIGLYFGGRGDCECCGNRWYQAYEYNASYDCSWNVLKADDLSTVKGGWDIPSYIHYKDGRVVATAAEGRGW